MRNKILVVDDQAELRMLVRMMLEQCGYEVSEAAEATAKKVAAPSAVLTDAVPPGGRLSRKRWSSS